MAPSGLRIAAGLELPVEYVTKTAAILAQRRKGKSYTGAVLAEEMYRLRVPFVALDPTGAWWGLRSSADGEKAGIPVVVIGGQHGDLPLEPTNHAGKVVAELVVEHPGYYVIDLASVDTHSDAVKFATGFLDRLYRLKGQSRDPLHLFVDEADFFAPQKPGPEETKMLGAMESIVRRGGILGLGSTLITQRAAVLNKNVLTQLDMLLILRVVGPQDRAAIDEYVKAAGTSEQRAELLGSLASLELGEAWVWEPGAEPPLYERVRIRQRRTFNSSATPKVGERRVEPRKLAPVDLEALRGRMAEMVEKAKANDPAELRRRVVTLERELARAKDVLRGGVEKPVEVEKIVKVPVFSESDLKRMERFAERVNAAVAQLSERVERDLAPLRAATERAMAAHDESMRKVVAAVSAPRAPRPAPHPVVLPEARADLSDERLALSNGTALPQPLQRIIDALAWYERLGLVAATKPQVAMVAGYAATSGGLRNLLSRAKTDELITYPSAGVAALTEKGRALARVDELPSTDEGVQEAVLARLPVPQQTILRVLIAVWPEALPKAEVAVRSGYEPTSGGFRNLLSKLRTGALIAYPDQGHVRAEDVLFPMSR